MSKPVFPHTSLYGITDSTLMPTTAKLVENVTAALSAGCKIIQFRDKSDDAALRHAKASLLLKACREHDALLLINDDVALCQAIDADGVHLGQSDMGYEKARKKLGDEKIIGITCHDQLELAQQAQAQGADYVAFGRFFPSKTKPGASYAPLSLLEKAKEQLSVPIVGIGGIDSENASQVLTHGANCVAVVNSLFAGDATQTATNTHTFLSI